ncbi:uncharacterized protein LOC135430172 [Drosophila montana]|uniref:uncharacterized protein LOC135430172 n=1 Tax=Drosophila montana TaxID=40370 RepID=UPI00313E372D
MSPRQQQGRSKSRPATESFRCRVCRGVHALRKCQRFMRLSPEKRLRAVLVNKYCPNCLAHQHSGESCRRKDKCRKCQGDHHTLLHLQEARRMPSRSPERSQTRRSTKAQARRSAPPSSAGSISLSTLMEHKRTTVLPRALIRLGNGKATRDTRALLDPCCPVSLIDASLAKASGLSVTRVGKDNACSAIISSRTSSFQREVILQVMPNLRYQTPTKLVSEKLNEPFNNVRLADDRWFQPEISNLVLGSDIYPDLILQGGRHVHTRSVSDSRHPTAM